ncbi:DNA-binding response regulator, partial [Methylocaldum sp. BRCS4]|nr:DNA-binding response regulator [Methylocaldum sp. BRCS4]
MNEPIVQTALREGKSDRAPRILVVEDEVPLATLLV